jgi:two-component system nitrate/nitrite response regulator NarL
MTEAAQSRSPSSISPSGVRVALLVGSEALARGLESVLLKALDDASVVQADLRSFQDVIDARSVEIVIVSIDQWPYIAEYSNMWAERGPRILVIGDQLHTRDPSLFSSLPANGFAGMADLSGERLSDILSRVMDGEMPMPPELARHLLSGSHQVVRSPTLRPVSLTPREKETLALLVKGMSNKQLARALGISTHGAKRLVTAILLKLGAPNRTAAVVAALESGLVSM